MDVEDFACNRTQSVLNRFFYFYGICITLFPICNQNTIQMDDFDSTTLVMAVLQGLQDKTLDYMTLDCHRAVTT